MKKEIIEIVKELVGHEILFLEEAVEIHGNQYTGPFNVWALSVSPADELFIMDNSTNWEKFSGNTDRWIENRMVATLYQRIKFIKHQSKKES